jgi:hypothetical protein
MLWPPDLVRRVKRFCADNDGDDMTTTAIKALERFLGEAGY